jgi:hypothetical protein
MRYVHGADGDVVATIDSSGRITLGMEPGAVVGIILSKTEVYADEAGAEWVGRIDPDRHIVNPEYEIVGTVDVSGRVLDPVGRTLGHVEEAVDGAVLILLIGRIRPEVISGPAPPGESEATMMDDVLELADEQKTPGVRKNFRPLTDAEVFGTPHKKPNDRR